MKSIKNILIGFGVLLLAAGALYVYHKKNILQDNVKIQLGSHAQSIQSGVQGAQKQVQSEYQKNAKAQEKNFDKLFSNEK